MPERAEKPTRKEKERRIAELKKRLENKDERAKLESIGFKLSDFTPIKDFFSWGANRTLTDLKIRRIADIKSREELLGKKPKHDIIQVMVIILVAVIVGMIAFTIISQFMSYEGMANNWAVCRGELEAAKAQLAASSFYSAPAAPAAPPAPALSG